MRAWIQGFVIASVLLAGSSRGQTPVVIVDWQQPAPTLATAKGLSYEAFLNAPGATTPTHTLSAVECTGAASPFDCFGTLAALPNGNYTLQIRGVHTTDTGGKVPGPTSDEVTFTLPLQAPTPPPPHPATPQKPINIRVRIGGGSTPAPVPPPAPPGESISLGAPTPVVNDVVTLPIVVTLPAAPVAAPVVEADWFLAGTLECTCPASFTGARIDAAGVWTGHYVTLADQTKSTRGAIYLVAAVVRRPSGDLQSTLRDVVF